MAYASKINAYSAHVVTKLVGDAFRPKSVVDFGCAVGGWLMAWKTNGVETVQGIDGPYVDPNALLIERHEFLSADLSHPINLSGSFDIAQSVEVAEHLPQASARILVAGLCERAPVVLFSAAPPGQGGRGHVNEQPYEYWRDLFAEQGFTLYDWVRPLIRDDAGVQQWYRYNLLMFIRDGYDVPETIRATLVPNDAPVPDVSPPLFRLRKAMVTLIPGKTQDLISTLLARIHG
ncbi:MAG: methyltransferase domain-containing protein [Alphaproteobacteria bacterium]|nr:methyltransferase domain-containing protein [Alphaproteobacteria bacterium]